MLQWLKRCLVRHPVLCLMAGLACLLVLPAMWIAQLSDEMRLAVHVDYSQCEAVFPAWISDRLPEGWRPQRIVNGAISDFQLDGRPDLLRRLSRAPCLRSLTLSSDEHRDWPEIGQFQPLEDLYLGLPSIGDATFQQLGRLRRLSSLTLCTRNLTASGFDQLEHLPELRNLTLCVDGLDDDTMRAIAKLPHIRSLTLYGLNAPPRFELLAPLAELRELKLPDDELPISDDNLAGIGSLTQLTAFDCTSPFGHRAARALLHLTHLERVSIRANITNEHLEVLSRLPILKELTLARDSPCNLTQLSRAPALEHLTLMLLSEDDVRVIAHLPKLATLTTHAHIDSRLIKQLKARRPDLQIEL